MLILAYAPDAGILAVLERIGQPFTIAGNGAVTAGIGLDKHMDAEAAPELVRAQKRPRCNGPPQPCRSARQCLLEIADQVVGVLESRRTGAAGRAGRAMPAPSTLARCSIRLSTPPSEVARFHSFDAGGRGDGRGLAALARAIDSMPPKPPCICRAATAWPGWVGSPG